MTLRRALATAAASTALLLVVASCGGNDGATAEKASDSSSASSASSASGSPSASGAAGDGTSAAGEEITAAKFTGKLTDALDKMTTAHLALDLGAAGTAEGDADYSAEPPEMTLTMTLASIGDIEGRLVDGKLFLKSPTLGEKWVAIPLDDPSSPLGSLGDLMDIRKAVDNFAASVTSVQDLGAEQVDGESLEHYAATVDTAKLAQSLPSQLPGAGSLPATLTQDWWFDGDGLLRKFSFDSGGTTSTFTLSKYGEDVTVEAPPADQVTSMPGTSGAS